MYDRSSMQRHASYSFPPQYTAPAPQKQYPTAHSTSSAFSASANPNEDWTKISDLAERRRIQNRIAQRNYRKKLKKRLEDLERRAGSSSASPEQKHEELPSVDMASLESSPANSGHARQRSTSNRVRRDRTPEVFQQYALPSDDRGMFSEQYTRQLSTSPPPFPYVTLPPADANSSYSTYPGAAPYCLPGSGVDMPMYHVQSLPPIQQAYGGVQGMTPPTVKQEYYPDDEMSPFSMSYASMAGVDVSTSQHYPEVATYTPSLYDAFEHSQSASSPESTTYPHTPASMPRTPSF